jgi:mercuric ion binding protein
MGARAGEHIGARRVDVLPAAARARHARRDWRVDHRVSLRPVALARPDFFSAALLKIAGVKAAKVSYRERLARVTFDDALTDVDALRAATRDVGYPAILK